MTNAERKNRESENIEKMILIEILWYQERNCQKKRIPRLIKGDLKVSDYLWKKRIQSMQENGYLESDTEELLPALTLKGRECGEELLRAAKTWKELLLNIGIENDVAQRDAVKMAITLSEKEYVDNVQKYIQKGMPRKVDAATLWEMAGQGRYLFWSMIYTNDEERKAADEYLRFEREGWVYIEHEWEMWTELSEHPENTDHRDIWYQDEKKNWKKARKIDRRIYIPLSAYSMDINTYLTNEIHCICNIAFVPEGEYETLPEERTERILEARLLYKITKVEKR